MPDAAQVIRPDQTPITLLLPLRSAEAATTLQRLLPSLQDAFGVALAKIPTVHFFRCVVIDGGGELAMIATVDGTCDDFIDALLANAGLVVDQILEFVNWPVPIPASVRRGEFKRYVQRYNVSAPFWFSASPKAKATEILAKAKAAGMDSGDPARLPEQNTLCLVLNVLSPVHAKTLGELMVSTALDVLKAFADIDTVHFARFLFLHNQMQFAIITVFDGPFINYSQDFTTHLGHVFDALLPHVEGGDSSMIPVQQHFTQFHALMVSANFAPPGIWYSAYPKLTVPNIQALIP